ncbi:glycerophosphodiester phosphodiesterase family protein [Streptomyces sp. NBC_00083]|uniref:glycerophosphodiester phosphodiesterase n=1 Tax=Streptomyces sp. NBC_00083 TaxID=2975647 RepID=UPI00225442EC|nr:glycerophosphodiester phosphodiesterase family protein [Streptomyces sp. NBC_00083]MCX5383966.1 glycerophosphodiester phosphodiesterase family protein [Streptomyces sp. NBC_00083]
MRHRTAVFTVVGALCGVLALALPAPATRAAPAAGHITVFGHRGAPAHAPENTLRSVRTAASLGVDWVENDVQRTRDGALVVIHDTTLDRTTDVEQRYPGRSPWTVGSFTLAEIKTLDAGGWFAPRFRGERVPTLQEYLGLLDRTDQNLLLELKQPDLYPGIERQTLDALGRAGWLDGPHVARRLVVQSFSASALRTTHRLRPAVRTGFLGAPPVAQLGQYAAYVDEINPEQRAVTAAYVRAVHALKSPHWPRMRVNPWTVDSTGAAAALVKEGVDGIITNQPDVIEKATHRRMLRPL